MRDVSSSSPPLLNSDVDRGPFLLDKEPSNGSDSVAVPQASSPLPQPPLVPSSHPPPLRNSGDPTTNKTGDLFDLDFAPTQINLAKIPPPHPFYPNNCSRRSSNSNSVNMVLNSASASSGNGSTNDFLPVTDEAVVPQLSGSSSMTTEPLLFDRSHAPHTSVNAAATNTVNIAGGMSSFDFVNMGGMMDNDIIAKARENLAKLEELRREIEEQSTTFHPQQQQLFSNNTPHSNSNNNTGMMMWNNGNMMAASMVGAGGGMMMMSNGNSTTNPGLNTSCGMVNNLAPHAMMQQQPLNNLAGRVMDRQPRVSFHEHILANAPTTSVEGRSSFLERNGVFHRNTWHSDEHMPQRRDVVKFIAQLLLHSKANPDASWKATVPYKARKMEERLYKSAPSFDAYMDKSALKERLKNVIKEIVIEKQRTAEGIWHSDEHLPHRREVVKFIAHLLLARKANPDPSWTAALPYKARKLEERLYRSAPSFEGYMDKSTLKERLKRVAKEIANKHRDSRCQRSSNSSDIGGICGIGDNGDSISDANFSDSPSFRQNGSFIGGGSLLDDGSLGVLPRNFFPLKDSPTRSSVTSTSSVQMGGSPLFNVGGSFSSFDNANHVSSSPTATSGSGPTQLLQLPQQQFSAPLLTSSPHFNKPVVMHDHQQHQQQLMMNMRALKQQEQIMAAASQQHRWDYNDNSNMAMSANNSRFQQEQVRLSQQKQQVLFHQQQLLQQQLMISAARSRRMGVMNGRDDNILSSPSSVPSMRNVHQLQQPMRPSSVNSASSPTGSVASNSTPLKNGLNSNSAPHISSLGSVTTGSGPHLMTPTNASIPNTPNTNNPVMSNNGSGLDDDFLGDPSDFDWLGDEEV